MSGTERYDDHYWDVIAERQVGNLIEWLRNFVDPQFRERVWQKGTGVGQFYEESATQFFHDFSIQWLVEEGLARLQAPASVIDELRGFVSDYGKFDETLPNWVDAVKLESQPAFLRIVAEANHLLTAIEQSRPGMRQIEDDV